MGKVNSCFKGVFVFFNILFGIVGGVLLALGILAHTLYHDNEEFQKIFVGVISLYIAGGTTMAISFLGAYGAYKEKKWPLIVFAAGMTLCFCGLLRGGILVMISRPKASQMEEQLRQAIPLDEAAPEFQRATEMFQSQMKCCGVFNGYRDWGRNVPASCLCPEQDAACERVPASRFEEMTLLQGLDSGWKLVFKQPCFPIFEEYLERIVNGILAMLFGFAFLALIGLMMSLVLIWYIQGHHLPTPMIFSVNQGLPKYTELYSTS